MFSRTLETFRRLITHQSSKPVYLSSKTSRISMSPIISELLRITVRPDFELESPQFAKLREAVVKIGVKEQYYGVHTDDPSDLLWVIRECSLLHWYPYEN